MIDDRIMVKILFLYPFYEICGHLAGADNRVAFIAEFLFASGIKKRGRLVCAHRCNYC